MLGFITENCEVRRRRPQFDGDNVNQKLQTSSTFRNSMVYGLVLCEVLKTQERRSGRTVSPSGNQSLVGVGMDRIAVAAVVAPRVDVIVSTLTHIVLII